MSAERSTAIDVEKAALDHFVTEMCKSGKLLPVDQVVESQLIVNGRLLIVDKDTGKLKLFWGSAPIADVPPDIAMMMQHICHEQANLELSRLISGSSASP